MKNITLSGLTIIAIFSASLVMAFSCSNNESPLTFENVWSDPTEQVNGTLETINNIEVMKLRGTHYEQGYAYGYLKAPEILHIINGLIQTEFKGMSAAVWENNFMESLENINIEDRFLNEFQGMLDGINARAENDAVIPVLERKLKLEDILIINCFHEVLAFNCSSFAAWGNMTEDGDPIIVKNNDWFFTSFSLVDMQFLCVRKQPSQSGLLSTISMTIPGIITMGAGINSDGIIAFFLDAQGLEPTQVTNITPRLIQGWDALEKTDLDGVIMKYGNILKSHKILVGGITMLGFPGESNTFEACVFEHDGNYSVTDGVTTRYPVDLESYIACTNDFRERKSPVECWRYNLMKHELDSINNSNGTEYLTVGRAWDMLSEVPIEGDLLYYTMVCEPAKGLMHLAVSRNWQHAPECEKSTFVINDLFDY